MKRTVILVFTLSTTFIISGIYSCRTQRLANHQRLADTLYYLPYGTGTIIEVHFVRGKAHNHPLMAIWTTDTAGNYLQTLYIARSIATGVFAHGETSTGKWMPGPIRRPAALPVWAHSRAVREDDGLYVPTQQTAIPDAYSGATPPGNFVVIAHADVPYPIVFDLYFEINQAWDWNEYWTTSMFPDDEEYKTSCQPSLIYHARVNSLHKREKQPLTPIGHGHYAGRDGNIYTELSTITTALDIASAVFYIVR